MNLEASHVQLILVIIEVVLSQISFFLVIYIEIFNKTLRSIWSVFNVFEFVVSMFFQVDIFRHLHADKQKW